MLKLPEVVRRKLGRWPGRLADPARKLAPPALLLLCAPHRLERLLRLPLHAFPLHPLALQALLLEPPAPLLLLTSLPFARLSLALLPLLFLAPLPLACLGLAPLPFFLLAAGLLALLSFSALPLQLALTRLLLLAF